MVFLRLAFATFIMFFVSVLAHGEPIKSSAGIELGGNGTLLLSDSSIGAFGVGAGLQGSVFYTMWDDRPIALKLRVEMLSMKEEAVQKSDTSYILPGSS